MGAAALTALVLGLSLGAGALEGVEHPLVRAGVAAYEALEYTEAVATLEKARAEPLSARERAVLLETLGSAKAVLDDASGAREAFAALLEVDPSFEMDAGTSPRIRVVFEEVRAMRRAASGAAERASTAPPQGETTRDAGTATASTAAARPGEDDEASLLIGPADLAPAEGAPVYREGWFWGVVGGVAAAVVVGVAVGLATRSTDGTLVVVPR